MIRRIFGMVPAVALPILFLTAFLATAPGAGEVYVTQSFGPASAGASNSAAGTGSVYVPQLPLNAKPLTVKKSTRPPFVEKRLLEQGAVAGSADDELALAITPYEGATPTLPDTGLGSQVSLLSDAATVAFPSVAGGLASGQEQ